MNMGVSNCLPRDGSAIHANVKPVCAVFSLQAFSDSPDQVEAGVIIIERQVENVGDVLLGDDQRVPRGYRVPIANRKRVFILDDYFGVRVTERTGGHRVSLHRSGPMFEAKLKIRQTEQMETKKDRGLCGRLRAKVVPAFWAGLSTPQQVSPESVDPLANFFDDDSLSVRGEGAGSKEQCAIDRRQRPCSNGKSEASFWRRSVRLKAQQIFVSDRCLQWVVWSTGGDSVGTIFAMEVSSDSVWLDIVGLAAAVTMPEAAATYQSIFASVEVFDQHDIVLNGIYALIDNPFFVRGDVKARRTKSSMPQINGGDESGFPGGKVEELRLGGGARVIEKENTRRPDAPPGEIPDAA
jgi:hypothetical protein